MDAFQPISVLWQGGKSLQLSWEGGMHGGEERDFMPQVVQVKNGENNNNTFLALTDDSGKEE